MNKGCNFKKASTLNTLVFIIKLAGTGYQPTQQQKVVPVSQSNTTPVKEEIYIDLIETLDYKLNTTGETTCLVRGVLNSSNVSNGQKQVNFQFKKGYGE